MKVEVTDKGFLVVPETDFEKDYLVRTFVNCKERLVTIKYGLSLDDLISVKVVNDDKV